MRVRDQDRCMLPSSSRMCGEIVLQGNFSVGAKGDHLARGRPKRWGVADGVCWCSAQCFRAVTG